jgi:tetratricopeptide (TPR) repeat protein
MRIVCESEIRGELPWPILAGVDASNWIITTLDHVYSMFEEASHKWSALFSNPLPVLTLLAAIGLLAAAILRLTKPIRVIVVSSFESPRVNEPSLTFTGSTIAQIVSDQIDRLLDESPDDEAWDGDRSYVSRSKSTRRKVTRPPQRPPLEIDLGGFSLESVINLWRRLRYRQERITGDVVFGSGQMTLYARMPKMGPWVAGPFRAKHSVLMREVRTLAEQIVADCEPQIMAYVYFARGDMDNLKKVALEWERSEPKNPDAIYYEGLAHQCSEQTEHAIKAYKRALAIRDDDPNTLINLGVAYFEKEEKSSSREKKYKEAIEAYRKALEIAPKDPEGLYNLANALLEDKDPNYVESIKTFRLALDLNPDDIDVIVSLAGALYEEALHSGSERYSEAEDLLRRVINQDPQHIVAMTTLGQILYATGRLDESVEIYRKILKKHPKDDDVLELLADALDEKKKYRQAIDMYEKVLKQRGPDAPVLSALGGAYYNDNKKCEKAKNEKAKKKLLEALKIEPKAVYARYFLALVYDFEGAYEKAIQELDEALLIEKDPMERADLEQLKVEEQEALAETRGNGSEKD